MIINHINYKKKSYGYDSSIEGKHPFLENDDGTAAEAIFSIKGQKKSESKSSRSQSTPKRILDRQLSQARKTWKIPALDPASSHPSH